jgi:hypothetical protein
MTTDRIVVTVRLDGRQQTDTYKVIPGAYTEGFTVSDGQPVRWFPTVEARDARVERALRYGGDRRWEVGGHSMSDVVKFSADPDGRRHARCVVCEERVSWPASTPVSDIADWLTRHRSHRGSA